MEAMGDVPQLVNAKPGYWIAGAATSKAPTKPIEIGSSQTRLTGIGNRPTLFPAQLERTREQDTAFDARVSVHSRFQCLKRSKKGAEVLAGALR